MSSLFGMNAVELTGSSSSSGGGDGSSNNSSSAPEPLQYQIMDFWPVTFVRQIIIMCKYMRNLSTYCFGFCSCGLVPY